MARHDVGLVHRAGRQAGGCRFELRLRPQRRQEIGHRLHVVACAPQIAHAEAVGLEFLILRIAGEIIAAGRLADLLADAAEADAENRREDIGAHRLAVALRRMAPGDMADLVRHDAGDFRLAVGEREQAARDMDIAAGQGEGVDDLGIEHGEGELLVGQLRGARQKLADAIDIAHQLGVVIFAAELLHELGMFLRADLLLLLRRHQRQHALAGRRIGGAAGEQRGAGEQAGDQGDMAVGHLASTSICSGWVTSIDGPLTASTQPRTRKRSPSNRLGSKPRPKFLKSRLAMAMVKSVL